jgi:3-oxoadipate enol-lactonase
MSVREQRVSSRRSSDPAATALCLAALVLASQGGACTALRPGAAPPPRSGVVAVDGGHLAYDVAGSGPTVVLVHGGLVDRRLWDDQFRDLARDHRVIRYDLRGLGRSSRSTGTFSYVDDLHRLMISLQVERATLVGLSLGGGIVTDYALDHPERVAALVLVGSSLRGVDVPPDPRAVEVFTTIAQTDPARAIAVMLDSLAMGSWDPQVRERLRVMMADNLSGFLAAPPWLQRWPEPPTVRRLDQIRVPTLVVIGTLDAKPLHVFADTLAARIPGAQLDSIPGAQHHLPAERPAEFTRLLRRFLRQVER